MFKHFVSALLFSFVFIAAGTALAQDGDFHVVHVQKWKMKSIPTGDEATAFNDMLKRQSEVINSDARVLSGYVLRHFWGADSRDLVMIAEFNNSDDLFSFYADLNSMMEKSMSKEDMDKDNALFSKYVGEHGDEIYRVVDGTSK